MRTALILASLLVAATLFAAAPTASAGPVRDACGEAGHYDTCDRLFTECRSTDVLLDAVCRDVINPTLRSL